MTTLHCCYCGDKFTFFKRPTWEHLIPMSIGGKNCVENRRRCCLDCNSIRGNDSYDIFIDKLEKAALVINIDQRQKLETMINNVKKIRAYADSKGNSLYTTWWLLRHKQLN